MDDRSVHIHESDVSDSKLIAERRSSLIAALPAPMPEDFLRAWMRFSNLQFSSKLMQSLLSHFGEDPREIFDAADTQFDSVPGFQARFLSKLHDPSHHVSDRQWDWFHKYGVRIVLSSSPDYPVLLKDISDSPPLLYVLGSLSKEDANVAFVGSRHATPYGRGAAEKLARELSAQGMTIVSGGAVGIDAASHRGALNGGGRTIAVLGCGLDIDYPRENRELFQTIAESGALVSEYPLGSQPETWHFPLRNRLISGMSEGVLVVEAPIKSGALNTAKWAAEQGRQLMAIPGNIDRPTSLGTNELLKDGASLILSSDDILSTLNLLSFSAIPTHKNNASRNDLPETRKPIPNLPRRGLEQPGSRIPACPPETATKKSLALLSLPEKQQKLLDCLTQTPQHIDQVALAAALPVSQAGIELTYLELEGLVRRLPGNTYIRTV